MCKDIDATRIDSNVASAKAAKEAFELAETLVDSIEPIRFWETLKRLVEERLPKKEVRVEPDKMTYQEALEFETLVIPYGVYQGTFVRELPIRYLLAITESKFSIKMHRYIKSRRFQDLLEKEE